MPAKVPIPPEIAKKPNFVYSRLSLALLMSRVRGADDVEVAVVSLARLSSDNLLVER